MLLRGRPNCPSSPRRRSWCAGRGEPVPAETQACCSTRRVAAPTAVGIDALGAPMLLDPTAPLHATVRAPMRGGIYKRSNPTVRTSRQPHGEGNISGGCSAPTRRLPFGAPHPWDENPGSGSRPSVSSTRGTVSARPCCSPNEPVACCADPSVDENVVSGSLDPRAAKCHIHGRRRTASGTRAPDANSPTPRTEHRRAVILGTILTRAAGVANEHALPCDSRPIGPPVHCTKRRSRSAPTMNRRSVAGTRNSRPSIDERTRNEPGR